MSLEPFAKKYGHFYVPRFEIDLAGRVLTDADGIVSDLSVSTSHDRADTFSFTLNNLFDPEQRQFQEIDWQSLESDKRVEISMGYEDELESMVVGRVESAEPEFPSNGVPTIGVNGFGRLHEMMSGTRSETWERDPAKDRVTDAAVVEKVLARGGYGFETMSVESTDLELPRIVQDNQTDYDFLSKRASRYNYEVFVQGDTFEFRSAPDDEPPVIELGYGDSLLSFSPQLDRSKGVKQVTVNWSARQGRDPIGATVKGDDPNGDPKVIRTPVESEAEAGRLAESEVARIKQGRVRGQGETVGLPELVAGVTIRLDGLTGRFGGDYYVESADHRLSTGGYTTSFRARKVDGGAP